MSLIRVDRAQTPLILAIPHGGTDIPPEYEPRFRSLWHARRDADWHMGALYAGLVEATIIATDISRSIIDCNRDPSGVSLYPGQATTTLCPTTDFDGEALYREGEEPDESEITDRRARWFDPYHTALAAEIARLRAIHPAVVLYDCHSIRSIVPRLFDGELPIFNIGTNNGTTCDVKLTDDVVDSLTDFDADNWSAVINGRFKGGWTTRQYGRPEAGVHAIQMELSMRGYVDESETPHTAENWPPPYVPSRAAPLRATIKQVLTAALDFAKGHA